MFLNSYSIMSLLLLKERHRSRYNCTIPFCTWEFRLRKRCPDIIASFNGDYFHLHRSFFSLHLLQTLTLIHRLFQGKKTQMIAFFMR